MLTQVVILILNPHVNLRFVLSSVLGLNYVLRDNKKTSIL